MPSLHFGLALIALWHARPFGRWARAIAAIFAIGTFLATLGLGEHYFVDLVVAFPFTLAIHAICTPNLPRLREQRRVAMGGALVLLASWYGLLFFGVPLLLDSVILTWMITGGTIGLVVWLERRLYRAGQNAFESVETPIAASPREPSREAPGPRGHLLLGSLIPFRRDVLGLLVDSHHKFGDVVRFRLGPHILHLVSHPDHIRHVLATHQANYNKDTRSSRMIRSITGEGLLTSSGEIWLRERRLVQPVFQPQCVASLVPGMALAAEQTLARWRPDAEAAKPSDLGSEMMRLTYTIVGKALFGADVSDELDTVERAATTVMEHTYRRLERIIDLPPPIPTPGNLRFRRELGTLYAIVNRIVAERRSQRTRATDPDLLGLLLQSGEGEDGSADADWVRNETITLLLAGHETTANALTWTFHLLSTHEEAEERAREEVRAVLGGRRPTADDLPKLDYATRVIKEAMRLYPPIWIMERRAVEDDVIGGCGIPAGSSVLISPWVIHRQPEYWENPERFDPDRFLPVDSAKRPDYAYIPFGGGRRLCVGANFAMAEAQIILSMALQAWKLRPAFDRPVIPKPGITLRVEGGLWMSAQCHEK